jgi:hypothetical protein
MHGFSAARRRTAALGTSAGEPLLRLERSALGASGLHGGRHQDDRQDGGLLSTRGTIERHGSIHRGCACPMTADVFTGPK